VNGIPIKIYKPDYKNDLYLEPYVALYEQKTDLNISKEDFKNGYTIYRMLIREENIQQWNLLEHGVTRLDMRFANPLPQVVTAIVYASFDGLVSIDMDKNISYK
jgi:hypothetical protein